MKKLLICFFLFLGANAAHTQTLHWAFGFGDPAYAISSYSVPDLITDIEVTSTGDYVVAGYFLGTVDADPSAPVQNIVNNAGGLRHFLAKYAPGGALQWVKTFDYQNNTAPGELALDAAGNIYFASAFQYTTDLDPGPGVFSVTSNGGWDDIFLAKFDANGDFQWATTFGGIDLDFSPQIGIDNSGNVVLAGSFYFTMDLDPSVAVAPATSYGLTDLFLVKLDPSGQYLGGVTMGGAGEDRLYDLDLHNNRIALCGSFSGATALDPANSGNTMTSQGDHDGFAAWYDAGTLGFLNAVQLGGSGGNDYASAALQTPSGETYLTGNYFQSMDLDPGPGAQTATATGESDLFLVKLDAGGLFLWGFGTGGGYTADGWDVDKGQELGTDHQGNIYLFGDFNGSADFDPSASTAVLTMPTPNQQNLVFVASYKPDGQYRWAFPIGGLWFNGAEGMQVSQDGSFVISGYFRSTADFDPSAGVYNLVSTGGWDAFIARYTQVLVGAHDVPAPDPGIRIDPTLGTGLFTLHFSEPGALPKNIRVTDLQGKTLYSSQTTAHASDFALHLDHLAAGLYFVSVEQAEGPVAVFKIVKN